MPLPDSNTATFVIKVGGTSIPDEISVLSVRTEANSTLATAKILMLDGNPATSTFDISSSSLFVPGSVVTIEAGYENYNTVILQTVIVSQVICVDEMSRSTLEVECSNTIEKKSGPENTVSVLTITYGDNLLGLEAKLVMKSPPRSERHVTAKFPGTGLVGPGKYITLKGLGDRFNGDYRMTTVRHLISDGNWLTETDAELSK
jgi:phage protein D